MIDDSKKAIGILLVEDNAGDANIISELLSDGKGLRYKLTRAATLADGLKRLQEDRINVVLLDLTLPDSSGIDTLKKVIETAPDVPILVRPALRMTVLLIRRFSWAPRIICQKSN